MKNSTYENLSLLIVEDNLETMEVLRSIMSFYFKSIHCAEDGCAGLELIEKFRPDIILSDIELPCINGIEMLKEAEKLNSDAILIFTTAHNDIQYLHGAIDIKVDAYLIKPLNVAELVDKLEKILKERVLIDHKESGYSISSAKLLHKGLSKREYEVFLDITKGIKPNNIAEKYGLKPKTISTYRKRILEKMSFNSNAELIKYAILNNLI